MVFLVNCVGVVEGRKPVAVSGPNAIIRWCSGRRRQVVGPLPIIPDKSAKESSVWGSSTCPKLSIKS